MKPDRNAIYVLGIQQAHGMNFKFYQAVNGCVTCCTQVKSTFQLLLHLHIGKTKQMCSPFNRDRQRNNAGGNSLPNTSAKYTFLADRAEKWSSSLARERHRATHIAQWQLTHSSRPTVEQLQRFQVDTMQSPRTPHGLVVLTFAHITRIEQTFTLSRITAL